MSVIELLAASRAAKAWTLAQGAVPANGLDAILAGRRILRREIAAFGDSRTAQNDEATAYSGGILNHSYKKNAGIAANLEIITRQKVTFPADLNFGVAGDTTSMMLAHIAAVLACRANVVVMLCGTNNPLNGVSYAQGVADIVAMLSALLAAGKIVILISELPRGDGTFATGFTTAFLQLREWQRTVAPALFPNVISVDAYSAMANYAQSTGRALDGMLPDCLHLRQQGAYFTAMALKPVIDTLFPGEAGVLLTTAGAQFSRQSAWQSDKWGFDGHYRDQDNGRYRHHDRQCRYRLDTSK